jgi:protein tyrosine/serine phosphatase
MTRGVQTLLGISIVLLLIAGPVAYALYDQGQAHHFQVVKEGVLYRSGQMGLGALKRVIHDFGIRTVVNLRDGYHHDGSRCAEDQAEEEYCRKEGLNFVRIPPRHWAGAPGEETADLGVKKFLEEFRNPRNRPVLIHCTAGTHRTGAYIAVYRMEEEGWSNERAIAELKAHGYTNLDEEGDILGYLENYRPGR